MSFSFDIGNYFCQMRHNLEGARSSAINQCEARERKVKLDDNKLACPLRDMLKHLFLSGSPVSRSMLMLARQ